MLFPDIFDWINIGYKYNYSVSLNTDIFQKDKNACCLNIRYLCQMFLLYTFSQYIGIIQV